CFFFQAEDGIRDFHVTGVQTCALPIFGLSYYRFNKSLVQSYLGFQTGSFYKSATARMRIDNPFVTKFYVEPSVTFNSWDYLESEDLLQDVKTTVLRRVNRKAAVDFG